MIVTVTLRMGVNVACEFVSCVWGGWYVNVSEKREPERVCVLCAVLLVVVAACRCETDNASNCS